MALLILQNHDGQVTIDGVAVDVNNNHIIVRSLPNSLIRIDDIIRLLDSKHMDCDTTPLNDAVIIRKPAHASNLIHWASIV